MSRTLGAFNYTQNYEVLNSYPLDARMITSVYNDLNDNATIPYPYKGMIIAVTDDGSNNGLYICVDKGTAIQYANGTTLWERVGSPVITGNTWTYSSDTLNLQMSTGGTVSLTGFTFVNTTGDTILGQLIISADTSPLILSGVTGNTSAATTNTKFLTLDENNNVIYQTGLTASLPYTGGTSSAGTQGTTAITSTLIVANETTGTTIDLSGAFTYTNSNSTTASAGGIAINTAPFVGGKTLHEIIQMIFYPSLPPTYSPQRSLSLVINPPSEVLALIDSTASTLTLNATFVQGKYSALSQPDKFGGLPYAYEFQGPGIPTNFTAYTSSLTSNTGVTNYVFAQGYNTWSATTYYEQGDIPVYSDGSPYYVPEFTNSGSTTNTDRIEGVHPIFATTVDSATLTQQSTLYSMIVKPSSTISPILITLKANDALGGNYQRFAVPQAMGYVSVISWFNLSSNSYVSENINTYWDITSEVYNVAGGANNVDYYLYTYNGGPTTPKQWRGETPFKIYYT